MHSRPFKWAPALSWRPGTLRRNGKSHGRYREPDPFSLLGAWLCHTLGDSLGLIHNSSQPGLTGGLSWGPSAKDQRRILLPASHNSPSRVLTPYHLQHVLPHLTSPEQQVLASRKHSPHFVAEETETQRFQET